MWQDPRKLGEWAGLYEPSKLDLFIHSLTLIIRTKHGAENFVQSIPPETRAPNMP